jgi:hypothetical protein
MDRGNLIMKNRTFLATILLVGSLCANAEQTESQINYNDWSSGDRWTLALQLDKIKREQRVHSRYCRDKGKSKSTHDYSWRMSEGLPYGLRVNEDFIETSIAESCTHKVADTTVANIDKAKEKFERSMVIKDTTPNPSPTDDDRKKMLEIYAQLTSPKSVNAFVETKP